ncbi:hypothetical protein [Aeropyrum camini]|uniref:Uncharacterized protein n=1 Tax=Aeropyrum camini SY1 = JCM 12091 TaxID=1198449 RepID=U3TE80_9CREN|nr:hypothetical protein [Aeropyrum camini]BAN90345.1 hypothetical protein ACAM_0876 [Aeropyrum camini SY1 = JCM 12091]
MEGIRRVRLAIPYHVFETEKGEGGIGFDASLWRAVDMSFRRSLLAVPISKLGLKAEGNCVLKPKMSPEEVLQGLREIARQKPSPYKVFKARLAALITPFSRGELDRVGREYVEAIQAANLASAILEMGVGRYRGVYWGSVDLELEDRERGGGLRLVDAPSPGYRGLVENDMGVRRFLIVAARACVGTIE